MNPAVLASTDSLPITFIASFLIWIMFGGLIFLWVIDGKMKKEQALHAFFACTFAWVVTHMIKSFYPTQRPFEISDVIPLTITIPFDSAFPSAHASTAFALATTIWRHNKKTGMFFIILAILVALGRVVSNVHFVADVVAGAGIGLFSALAVGKLHLFTMLNSKKAGKRPPKR